MNILLIAFFAYLLIAFNPLLLEAKDFKKGEKLKINVSQTKLKNSPKPFGGKVLQTLKRGDSVVFLEPEGSFFRVEFGEDKGYIPSKSLIESKKFKSFSTTADVTDSDMAAATKGFSPEVEKKNREKNKDIRYDLMDKAEEISSVADPEGALQGFREKGKLGEYRE